MLSLNTARLLVLLGVAAASTFAARAENCASSNRPVSGTLASASNPCTPAPAPNVKKPTVVRGAPKAPDAMAPGTYRYGNTTVHIGGSVSTDVNVRGR
jgi:hypothetical protein